MNDYKQKTLETAHCHSDPLNIYILLAGTDPVFITVVAPSKSQTRATKLKVSGFPAHDTGCLGVKRAQGQTESQGILVFLLSAASCVIYHHHYYLLNAYMAVTAFEVKIFFWRICMGHFYCSSRH